MPEHREDLIASKGLHNVLFALNWSQPLVTSGVTMPFHPTLKMGSCADADFHLQFVSRTNTTGVMASSRDLLNWTSGGAMTDGSPVAIADFYADAPILSTEPHDILATGGGKSFKSGDAGATWSAGVTIGASVTAIARHLPLNIVLAAGFNAIYTGDVGATAYTARTVPGSWTALTAADIIVPRSGETSAGALILPVESSLHVAYSADGITWVDTTIASGQPIAGTWSEKHQAWFVLTSNGIVYKSAAPVSAWTAIATLYNPSGFRYSSIISTGYNFVICGTDIAASYNVQVGSILVTSDFKSFYPISTTTDAGETAFAFFENRVVVGHVTGAGPYGLTLSTSLRLP